MERETRIELATNSLEGCDSTIELLPRFHSSTLAYAGHLIDAAFSSASLLKLARRNQSPHRS